MKRRPYCDETLLQRAECLLVVRCSHMYDSSALTKNFTYLILSLRLWNSSPRENCQRGEESAVQPRQRPASTGLFNIIIYTFIYIPAVHQKIIIPLKSAFQKRKIFFSKKKRKNVRQKRIFKNCHCLWICDLVPFFQTFTP